jgi:hypothetical protein
LARRPDIEVTTAVTHIGIQETLDGKVVDWDGKVTDEQNEHLTM